MGGHYRELLGRVCLQTFCLRAIGCKQQADLRRQAPNFRWYRAAVKTRLWGLLLVGKGIAVGKQQNQVVLLTQFD